jgi:hypothetical protein
MRVPGIAVYTVAALVTGEMIAQASESPEVEDLQDSFQQAETVTTTQPNNIVAIAAPEVIQDRSLLSFASSDPVVEKTQSVDEIQQALDAPDAALTPVISQNAADLRQLKAIHQAETAYVKQILANSPTPTVSTTRPAAPVLKAELTEEAVSQRSPVESIPLQVASTTPNASCARANTSMASPQKLAQGVQNPAAINCPRPEPVAPLTLPEPYATESSPALSIYIPVGYGADNNTVFLSGSFQEDVRFNDQEDGGLGLGIGLGDSRDAVGVELSYASASFGRNRDFGSGGFNAKIHRQFPGDFAVAVGGNGILNLFDRNDFEQSYYGTVTKVFRTRESINDIFSRIALTVGVGNGQYRSSGAVDDGVDNINAFGNIAIRIARPVSFITEWTGRDLALGLSIAPFKNVPLTITPALRDVAGAGDGARFVLGAGIAFRF